MVKSTYLDPGFPVLERRHELDVREQGAVLTSWEPLQLPNQHVRGRVVLALAPAKLKTRLGSVLGHRDFDQQLERAQLRGIPARE